LILIAIELTSEVEISEVFNQGLDAIVWGINKTCRGIPNFARRLKLDLCPRYRTDWFPWGKAPGYRPTRNRQILLKYK
jgi:hypothetical protein